LNAIYRKAARKEIIQQLTSRGLTLDILGINVKNQADFTKYFAAINGRTNIESKKQELLDLIKNQRKDLILEIEDAIKEIKKFLQERGIGTEKEQKILGNG